MNNLDYDDYYCDASYDRHGREYILVDERYDNIRGNMEDLVSELYDNLKDGLDLREIHRLMSSIAGEMDIYLPEDKIEIKRIA